MMRSAKGVALLAMLSAVLVVLPGCLKVKQAVSVQPDGSGKMEFRLGFNPKAIQDAMGAMGGGMGGGAPQMADPTDVDLADFEKNWEGFVAFTEPKLEESVDGWKFVTFTGYFEDANKVKVYQEGPDGTRSLKTSMSFQATDKGYVLTVSNTLAAGNEAQVGQMDQMPPEMGQMVEAMLAVMMKGFSVEESFRMPGDVTAIEGLPTKAGRIASRSITESDVKDLTGVKKLAQDSKLKITCGASQVSAEEIRAFKAELEQAKTEWAALKAKAAAAKEEGAGEDDGEDGGEDDTEDK